MGKNNDEKKSSIFEKGSEKLNSLYYVFSSTSEFFKNNTNNVELIDHEKALLCLIAHIIIADGKVEEAEVKRASDFFRRNTPPHRANKLLSYLENTLKDTIEYSIQDSGKILNQHLTSTQKNQLYQSLIQYAHHGKIIKEQEQILNQIGLDLEFTDEEIDKRIHEDVSLINSSQTYGKLGGAISTIIALVALVFLALFLRPIFLGLAAAYIMDPIITFFEKKTRFSRNTISLTSVILTVTLVAFLAFKLFMSIDTNSLKTFLVNAPQEVGNGVKSINQTFINKKVPAVITDQINDLINKPLDYTSENLFPESYYSYTKSGRLEYPINEEELIKKVINLEVNNSLPLIVLFPELSHLQKKSILTQRIGIVMFFNSLLDDKQKREKFLNQFNGEMLWINPSIKKYIDKSDKTEHEEKLLIRNILSENFSLRQYLTRPEEISLHMKDHMKDYIKTLSGFFGGFLGSIGKGVALLVDLMLAIGFYYFFSKDFYRIGKGIREVFPIAYRINTDQIFTKITRVFEGYLRGEFLLIITESIFYSLIFYIANIPYPFLIGIIAGAGVIIPYLGLLVGFGLALTAAISGGMAIGTASIFLIIVFGLMNLIENFILAPKLIGDRVGLSDLETLIAIVAGGALGGVVGVVVAIPAAGILKIFATMFYDKYKESDFYSYLPTSSKDN